ncbi:PilZ domain-containing protein [Cohnella lubricantis]|uniref:PilZ domain-containing protein n=1 Tax=Cohnella lubricantis TaxID=2163172 RepID=A0A841TEH1_9BACL|nr:PilZ domain-containing protein [Cohnella lubricantis]MBB6676851.1 PilZ domain-containing protein [Cohnella lubricantis]MBP2119431.1 hypothetical protein [Cohnella lubricantis]
MTSELMPSGCNRREHVRLQLVGGVRALIRIVRINGMSIRTHAGALLLLNISPGGCGFRTPLLFPVTSRIWLEMEWDTGEDRLQLIGQIVWRKPEEAAYRYGMRFLPLSEAQRLRLHGELNKLVLKLTPGQSRIHILYRSMSDAKSRMYHSMDGCRV